MKTGYERVKVNENFYYVNGIGRCDIDVEMYSNEDDTKHDTANYYDSLFIAKENARADELMRRLRRFAVEHNECELDWNDKDQMKYYIVYDYANESFYIYGHKNTRSFGCIYFSAESTALRAIEVYRKDLLWYFTEYCDHIVEVETIECEHCGNAEKLQAMKVLGYKACPYCGKELKND